MRAPKPDKKAILLGIGLDGDDGHIRATRGEDFQIIGGSHETHQVMQEKCIQFTEKVRGRGKPLGQLQREEFLEIASECDMRVAPPPRPNKDPDRS